MISIYNLKNVINCQDMFYLFMAPPCLFGDKLGISIWITKQMQQTKKICAKPHMSPNCYQLNGHLIILIMLLQLNRKFTKWTRFFLFCLFGLSTFLGAKASLRLVSVIKLVIHLFIKKFLNSKILLDNRDLLENC